MLKKLLGVVLGASLLASPVQARLTGAPGAYLASQTAMKSRDYDAAARYLARALAFDGGNAKLLENAVHANVALGDLETALPHAQSLSLLNTSGQLADLVVLVDLVGRGEYHAALGKLRSEQSRVSPLMRGLMIGWMHEALGEYEAEAAQLLNMGEGNNAIAQFARYHHGLVLARRGDLKGAQEQLESGAVVPIRAARNSVEIYARILAAQGLREQAIQVISEELATGRSNVQLTELRNRLALGEPVTFSGIVTPQDAVADILQSFAGIVMNGKQRDFALLYARLALHLDAANEPAIFAASEILEEQGQFDLAVEVLERVAPESPAYLRAEILRAKATEAAGELDAAVEILRRLERDNGRAPAVHTALGLMFRTSKQFDECVKSYSAAIELIDEPRARDWYVYYSRAICHERGDRWEAAEADFRQALERAPEQPLVLNYLGYSMVEKGQSIDEAKGMIERAVAARPDSGYVTDSLGWVLFRLGEFEAAVPHMERAVELEPLDPVINDHLGDVLWKVGREREARFQWRRALSFGPEPEEAARIRLKLEKGLDAVLEDEARLVTETPDAHDG